MICQNKLQKVDIMFVKWAVRGSGNNCAEMGHCGKVETVVLKLAGRGKLKQGYGNGLLQKVETVVLKCAVVEV